MKMYQHDLKPSLRVLLTDGGKKIDLTSGVTSIKVVGVRNGETVFSREAAGDASGVVTMPWQAGDTDATGRIVVEVEVTWADGKPQTFRPEQGIEVVRDLG